MEEVEPLAVVADEVGGERVGLAEVDLADELVRGRCEGNEGGSVATRSVQPSTTSNSPPSASPPPGNTAYAGNKLNTQFPLSSSQLFA